MAPVMVGHPPELIEPWRLAERGAQLEGELDLSAMTRLRPSLGGSEGSASFSLKFSTDEQGCRRVSGTVSARLTLICQRCMEPMVVNVGGAVALGLAPDMATAARLPEDVDPLVLDREAVSLTALIEDELILALPLVAMHEESECAAGAMHEDRKEARDAGGRNNPFAVLGELRSESSDGDD